MAKKLLIIGALALVMALAVAPAALGVANGYGGNVSTLPGSGTVGTVVTVTGEAGSGETFPEFRFCTQNILVAQNVTANEIGAFSFQFTVPQGADTGVCTLRGTGSQGTVVTQTFTVTGTSLAYTGAQIAFWLLAGLGLMALGAGLIINRKAQTA